jgi:hypothetical protein
MTSDKVLPLQKQAAPTFVSDEASDKRNVLKISLVEIFRDYFRLAMFDDMIGTMLSQTMGMVKYWSPGPEDAQEPDRFIQCSGTGSRPFLLST